MRVPLLAAISFITFTAAPIRGESGDAAAVIQYCGAPTSEHQGMSQVTNVMERDLTYGEIILHFEPRQDGWNFLSGWGSHTVLTRRMVEDRMPCFHDAMEASAATLHSDLVDTMDPTIRAQTSPLQAENSTFGIPHLALIFLLALMVLIVYLFLPRRGRLIYRAQDVEQMRTRRRPRLERFPLQDEE